MSQAADRYAVALFDLALEMNQVTQWQAQMRLVRQGFADQPELTAFFNAHQIGKDEKKNFLKAVLEGRVDPPVMHFFCLLADKQRLGLAIAVCDRFHSLCNQHLNIAEGTVYSARKLDAAQIRQLATVLAEKAGKPVTLNNKLDPRLISGVRITLGQQILDWTMKNRLESLKNDLLKESR